MNFTTNELYWAAGFIEGEGCFHGKDTFINVCQKQREPLERLERMFGGRINKHTKRDIYSWNLCGPKGRGIMMMLYPLMSPRRQEQIRKSLDAWKNIKYSEQGTGRKLSSVARAALKKDVAGGMRECDLARKHKIHRMTAKYYMKRAA